MELTPPRSVIGKNTVECMQSGAVFGFAGLVDGLIRRIRATLEGTGADPEDVTVVVTGHTAPMMLPTWAKPLIVSRICWSSRRRSSTTSETSSRVNSSGRSTS